jgi:hypothetical protein
MKITPQELQVKELATPAFIARNENVVLLMNSGAL